MDNKNDIKKKFHRPISIPTYLKCWAGYQGVNYSQTALNIVHDLESMWPGYSEIDIEDPEPGLTIDIIDERIKERKSKIKKLKTELKSLDSTYPIRKSDYLQKSNCIHGLKKRRYLAIMDESLKQPLIEIRQKIDYNEYMVSYYDWWRREHQNEGEEFEVEVKDFNAFIEESLKAEKRLSRLIETDFKPQITNILKNCNNSDNIRSITTTKFVNISLPEREFQRLREFNVPFSKLMRFNLLLEFVFFQVNPNKMGKNKVVYNKRKKPEKDTYNTTIALNKLSFDLISTISHNPSTFTNKIINEIKAGKRKSNGHTVENPLMPKFNGVLSKSDSLKNNRAKITLPIEFRLFIKEELPYSLSQIVENSAFDFINSIVNYFPENFTFSEKLGSRNEEFGHNPEYWFHLLFGSELTEDDANEIIFSVRKFLLSQDIDVYKIWKIMEIINCANDQIVKDMNPLNISDGVLKDKWIQNSGGYFSDTTDNDFIRHKKMKVQEHNAKQISRRQSFFNELLQSFSIKPK